MSIVQTALVFVGIPLGVVLLLTAAVFGRTEVTRTNRYRPGKPWQYAPVWYIPHPENLASNHEQIAIESDASAPTPSATGGAVGEW